MRLFILIPIHLFMKRYKNKPIKLAKCGNHSLADCQKRFNKYTECKTCTLVHHRFIPIYIYINGVKYKRCPHCKQYYKLDMFAKNNGKHKRLCSSWCKKCINQYNINAYENNQ